MKTFYFIEDQLSRVFKLATAIALFVQMIIVFVGVIMRYCFNNPQPWIDEISTYLLIVITYLGGFVALRSNSMANITFLVDAVPPKVRKYINILADILIMILMFFVAYYGYLLCASQTVLKQRTPSLQIPIIIFYCLVPISGALMELSMIGRLIGHITGKENAAKEEGAFVE